LNGKLDWEKVTKGFSFVVQNVKGRRMLFEIEIWSEEDAKKNPRPKATWQDFHWDSVCGEQPEKPDVKKPKS